MYLPIGAVRPNVPVHVDGLWKQIDAENQLGPLDECLMPLQPGGNSALMVKDARSLRRSSSTPIWELLRPLAPAVPLADSVFCDGPSESAAYRVIAPLANGCAAVAVYNLRHGKESTTIDGQVRAADYAQASGMLQPYPGPWKIPSEGLVVFDFQEGKGRRLDEPYRFGIEGFNYRLLLVCPISQGWAVVGRGDKYLAPAAVQRVSGTSDRLEVALVESGPLVIWSAKGRPIVAGQQSEDLGNGFWRANLPVGKAGETLAITRELRVK